MLSAEIQEIVRQFFRYEIIQVSTDKPFELASGKFCPVYIDHRRLFSFPELRKSIVKLWAPLLIQQLKKKPDMKVVFAGTATAGIAPAYALASYFDAGFVYVRSEAKAHGLGKIIEGVIPPDATVVIVDDIVTTGKSLLKATQNLRELGYKVSVATSITRHDLNITRTNIENAHLSLVSLFKTEDLFDAAYRLSIIDSKQMRGLMQWFADEQLAAEKV